MSEPVFDTGSFSQWFHETTGRAGGMSVEPLKGGGSCEMFELRQGGERFAIRRAPVAAVSDTAHNVVREFQIIEALADSVARVPTLLASCEDTAVIGAPFYVMHFIDGEVIRRKLPNTYQEAPDTQTRIGEELIDALIELHSVTWRGTALEAMAKPEQFLERQVNRWSSQLEGYRSRDMPGVDTVAHWLESNRPKTEGQDALTVMHGDYKVDNAMFSKTAPPQILSLVDFEMTTVGDPLIDLAWCMIFWPEPDNLIAIAPPGAPGGMAKAYCQTPAQLIERYAQKTGRDTTAFQWYQAFAAWKLGIVLEASYAKFLSGASKNPNHEFFGYLVDQLMARAQRFAC
ncbi:MAG: phosphotransferase family protein [Halioglobus sp.]